ncbi:MULTISPECIES: type II toxin-antitoxin system RelE/ParE family toxin [unclassified Rhizobium]|uniref:type II toxin-antitoxin system RelE/ParE family toxin n=1 Tax=unclassified Rhizobium TaxID=2613769 RepID=UPI001FCE514F|nr:MULTISPECIES: type II toxin-antitoxin system RelE/ParE family toxin [unclassified Rhizobium]
MQICKTKILARFLRKERISDPDFVEACHRANRGLIDANLGGGLIKQGVTRPEKRAKWRISNDIAFQVRESRRLYEK